uniref:Doublecortin domain-containing protein n=1 Tax=Leptobrachium leishanense TaxID=445787 RepID=A0A8C5PAJ2_9ANUR
AGSRSSPVGVQSVPHAKNVMVFRNGDPFHKGRRMVVNEKQFVTFEAFLNDVTNSVQAPAAVRNIYTPRNGHRVNNISDLINKGQYVAAGTEKFRKLDQQKKKKKFGPKNHCDTTCYIPVFFSLFSVFRNGDLRTPPFRVLLAPGILREWELVLTLLTEKANLYNGAVRRLCTLDGVSLSSGSELVSGEYYVAVGSEKYKCLPYEELLTLHRNKYSTQNVSIPFVNLFPNFYSVVSNISEIVKVFSTTNNYIKSVPSKELHWRIDLKGSHLVHPWFKIQGEGALFFFILECLLS